MMNRWKLLLSLLLLVALGSNLGDARRLFVFSRGGSPVQGWFTLKIIDFHKHRSQGLTSWNGRDSVLGHLDDAHALPFPQSFVCDTCLDISTFAEQVLTDPETIESVLEYVNGSFCNALSGLQKECISLAQTYVPQVLETLQAYAAPDKLCGETKLCASSAMLLLSDAHACKMCSDFATEALSYIQDNHTEEEVLQALHAQCSKLGDFSSRCNNLVDTYAPIYIQKVDSVTADQVCQKIGMCSTRSLSDPNHCATCEFAMFQLKAKLRNPAVQEKMLEMLLDGCSKVPGHIDQCKEIINQYGPFILANIDSYVDPETICTEIHACDSKKKLNEDMVIRLPRSHHNVAHL